MRLRLLVLVLLLAPSPAAAWWEYGHHTIARIAETQVEPRTRWRMRALLARAHLLETPTCPARSLAEAAYWPDCVRRFRDRFSHTFPWHQQNVDICRPFDPASACRDGNCVMAQVERQQRLLADRALPPRERVMALAFLAHFVGDLHQPMHAGDRGDFGGNRFPVAYGIIAGRTNLHLSWDGYIAERAMTTPPAGVQGLLSDFDEPERAAMRGGTVADWAQQSWQAARDYAYGSVLPDPCAPVPAERPVISEAITQRLIPIVRRQVVRGGLRLARLLDGALADQPVLIRPIEERR
ncbi:MAG: S1/P1 nuclease [Sphingosinicella sp.]